CEARLSVPLGGTFLSGRGLPGRCRSDHLLLAALQPRGRHSAVLLDPTRLASRTVRPLLHELSDPAEEPTAALSLHLHPNPPAPIAGHLLLDDRAATRRGVVDPYAVLPVLGRVAGAATDGRQHRAHQTFVHEIEFVVDRRRRRGRVPTS